MSLIRRCALVTRFADARVAESAALLARHLSERHIEVLALESEAERLPDLAVRFVADDTLADDTDLVIAIAAGRETHPAVAHDHGGGAEIGRASCRERVCLYV